MKIHPLFIKFWESWVIFIFFDSLKNLIGIIGTGLSPVLLPMLIGIMGTGLSPVLLPMLRFGTILLKISTSSSLFLIGLLLSFNVIYSLW